MATSWAVTLLPSVDDLGFLQNASIKVLLYYLACVVALIL
jgi:hypothetical protein